MTLRCSVLWYGWLRVMQIVCNVLYNTHGCKHGSSLWTYLGVITYTSTLVFGHKNHWLVLWQQKMTQWAYISQVKFTKYPLYLNFMDELWRACYKTRLHYLVLLAISHTSRDDDIDKLLSHRDFFIIRFCRPSECINWYVNIGSGNGLVPLGKKPLPESMFTYESTK